MTAKKLLLMLATILCIKSNATNYYFSSSEGDDSRSSTDAQDPSTPWRSIDKLNTWFPYLQPGDQVLFKSGDVFYGSIVTRKSGTSAAPIVLSSYGNGPRPAISGFSVISDWDAIGNGIYVSNELPAGAAVNSVIINGQQYAMGRYPNADDANGGYLTFEAHGNGNIMDHENPFDASWEDAQIVFRTTHGSMDRSYITKVAGNNIFYSPSLNNELTNNYGYFVQNDIKTLDQFGDWYYSPSSHRLYVYFGSADPSNYIVKASTVDVLLTVHSSNLTVEDLRFTGANEYAIFNEYAGIDNLQVNNCRIVFSGIDAIALAGTTDFVLQGSTILNTNSNAINLYYNNINPVIKTSTIQNTALFPGMLIPDVGHRYGMSIYSANGMTVLNNNIINSGWIPIYFWGSNNLIQNNYINTYCTVLDDGGGIYTFGGRLNPTFYNRKVISNIILNGIGAPAGTYNTDPNYNPAEGIYLDDNTTNVEVVGNSVAYCGDAGIYAHNARGTILRRNVFYNNHIQMAFQHDALGAGLSGGVYTSNQAFSKSPTQLVTMFQSYLNDFTNFGYFDSNYYCRPMNENDITYVNWFFNKEGYYNLSEWQNIFGEDMHSKKTPIAVADTSDILFYYNETTSDKTFDLDGTYMGLNSVVYNGSVELPPFTSVILLKKSNQNGVSANAMSSASAEAKIDHAAGGGYVTGASKLNVKAYPNPSSYYFNVTAQGNSAEPMTLRIIDLSGRLIETRTGITSNTTLQIGQNLKAGTYIFELMQGGKTVQQKVIKSSK